MPPLFLFRRAGHIQAAGDFQLYHTSSNLSIEKINKIIIQENPEFVQNHLLTSGAVYGILMVSRGESSRR